MVVAEIHVFPVKGLAGIAVPSTRVEACGLQHDRRWLAVDGIGRFVTQRVLPSMAAIRTEVTPQRLRLSHPGHGSIDVAVPGPEAARIAVTVWRNTLQAALAGPAADAWLSAALGQELRLVHMHDPSLRPINPAYGLPGESVSFADGYPVLLASLASLADGRPLPRQHRRRRGARLGRGLLAPGPHRVGRVPGSQALRPLHRDYDRPAHGRAARQERAAAHAGHVPP